MSEFKSILRTVNAMVADPSKLGLMPVERDIVIARPKIEDSPQVIENRRPRLMVPISVLALRLAAPADRLAAGAHLHWTVPDALTRGTTKPPPTTTIRSGPLAGVEVEQPRQLALGSDLVYPELPDRWLVARLSGDASTRLSVQAAWWIDSRRAVARPFPESPEIGDPAVHFTAVGTNPRAPDPWFSALYRRDDGRPDCRNRLGFHDPSPGRELTLHYAVMGWYSADHVSSDPLHRDHPLTLAELHEQLAASSWTVAEAPIQRKVDVLRVPQRLLCFGMVSDVVVHDRVQPPASSTRFYLGPSGADSLACLLRESIDQAKDLDDAEKAALPSEAALALFDGDHIDRMPDEDGLVGLLARLHQSRFAGQVEAARTNELPPRWWRPLQPSLLVRNGGRNLRHGGDGLPWRDGRLLCYTDEQPPIHRFVGHVDLAAKIDYGPLAQGLGVQLPDAVFSVLDWLPGLAAMRRAAEQADDAAALAGLPGLTSGRQRPWCPLALEWTGTWSPIGPERWTLGEIDYRLSKDPGETTSRRVAGVAALLGNQTRAFEQRLRKEVARRQDGWRTSQFGEFLLDEVDAVSVDGATWGAQLLGRWRERVREALVRDLASAIEEGQAIDPSVALRISSSGSSDYRAFWRMACAWPTSHDPGMSRLSWLQPEHLIHWARHYAFVLPRKFSDEVLGGWTYKDEDRPNPSPLDRGDRHDAHAPESIVLEGEAGFTWGDASRWAVALRDWVTGAPIDDDDLAAEIDAFLDVIHEVFGADVRRIPSKLSEWIAERTRQLEALLEDFGTAVAADERTGSWKVVDLVPELENFEIAQLDAEADELIELQSMLRGADMMGALLSIDGEVPGPLAAGRLQLTRLALVDTFGQRRSFAGDSVTVAAAWREPKVPGRALLPPRIHGHARLSLRLRSASDDDVDADVDHSAVCGWLLPDHLDEALEIFDQRGRALGQLGYRRDAAGWPLGVRWQTPPGEVHPPTGKPEGVANPHLAGLVNALLERERVDSKGEPGPWRYLAAVLRLIDSTQWTVDPIAGALPDHRALVIGRPVAVVRAQLTLELRAGGGDYRIPVRLGDVAAASDGLLGYFVDDDYGRFFPVHERTALRVPNRPPYNVLNGKRSSDRRYLELTVAHPCVSTEPHVELQPGRPVKLTLLVDPRGAVHLTAGLVPRKRIELLRAHVEPALATIAPTFRVGPILGDPSALRMPLPAEIRAGWSWVDRTDVAVWREQPVTHAEHGASFGGRAQIIDGWLKMSAPDPATEGEQA